MRAASFGVLTQPTLTIFTYIHKYSGFFVVLISVGLAQAHPNNFVTLYCFEEVTIKIIKGYRISGHYRL